MSDRTRRGLLAGLGTVALTSVAGCSALDREGDDAPPRLEPEEVEAVLETAAPDVRRPAPVQPASQAIEDGLSRFDDLVDAVPESISREQIPNGVVRQEVERARQDAIDAREAVDAEPDRLRALKAVGTAREYAREAAVGFEAVREDLAADVEAERNEARTAVGTRLAQVEYAGDDRERTLLLAFRLEELLTEVRRRLTYGLRPTEPNALDVAEAAGDVEYGVATIDTVEALEARHAATVDDWIDFATTAAGALESTMVSLGRAGLPDSDTSAEEVLGDEPERRDLQFLAGNAIGAVSRWQENLSSDLHEGRFASGIERAIRLERDARALDTVVQRIDGGDVPEPETADPIREEREAALAAAEALPTSASEPSVAGDVVARLLQTVEQADGELERALERDTDVDLSREYAIYVHLRARLEELPDAVETVRGRLDTYAP